MASTGSPGGLAVADPAPEPSARPARRSTARALALVVAVHLLVAWFSRPFPHWADPTRVFEYARSYPDVPLDHHALRLGTLVPARLAIEVFGYGTVAYYAVPLVMGILLVVATFFLGDLLFGRAVALAASLVLVLNPYVVESYKYVTGWQLMPDIPSAALFTSGVVCLLLAARASGGSRTREVTALLAAGAFFGWAYLAREYAVFVFPLIPVLAFAWRIRWFKLVYVAVPMLAALALELVMSRFVYGDPLARLNVASEHGGALPEPVTRVQAVFVGARAMDHPAVGALLVLLLVATIAGVLLRRRAHVVLAVWVLLLYVPVMLLSGLIDPVDVSLRGWLPRYWTLVYPAVAVGGTAVLVATWTMLRSRVPPARRRAATVAAGVVVAAAVAWYAVPAVATVTGDRGGTQDWLEVTRWLDENESDLDAVWTDTRSDAPLGIYRQGRGGDTPVWDLAVGRFSPFADAYPAPPPDQSVALVAAPRWTRPPLPHAATGWSEVLVAGDLVVYLSRPVGP